MVIVTLQQYLMTRKCWPTVSWNLAPGIEHFVTCWPWPLHGILLGGARRSGAGCHWVGQDNGAEYHWVGQDRVGQGASGWGKAESFWLWRFSSHLPGGSTAEQAKALGLHVHILSKSVIAACCLPQSVAYQCNPADTYTPSVHWEKFTLLTLWSLELVFSWLFLWATILMTENGWDEPVTELSCQFECEQEAVNNYECKHYNISSIYYKSTNRRFEPMCTVWSATENSGIFLWFVQIPA